MTIKEFAGQQGLTPSAVYSALRYRGIDVQQLQTETEDGQKELTPEGLEKLREIYAKRKPAQKKPPKPQPAPAMEQPDGRAELIEALQRQIEALQRQIDALEQDKVQLTDHIRFLEEEILRRLDSEPAKPKEEKPQQEPPREEKPQKPALWKWIP